MQRDMDFCGAADHYKWVWIGIAYLVACIMLFNLAIIWAHKALGGMYRTPCYFILAITLVVSEHNAHQLPGHTC